MARKFSIAICLSVVALFGLSTALSAQAPALQPLSPRTIDWIAGSSAWVNLTMTSTVAVDNVAVTVIDSSEGVSVRYPSNREFSSLSQDSSLSRSEIDYSSINFTTPASPGTATATIQIDYELRDVQHSIVETLEFSNIEYEGDDFAILTDSAELSSSEDALDQNWLELGYLGISPMSGDLEVSVTGVMEAHHPRGTFTSLVANANLSGGERDVARVWFDPDELSPGTFTLTVNVDYVDINRVEKSLTHDVTVTID